MIVTVTANPSLDRTLELPGPLTRGEVQRAQSSEQQPGGKGVNIARVLTLSGVDCTALLPGDPQDPVLQGLDGLGIRHAGPGLGAPLRSNVTITEPDGTTTKINERGPELSEVQASELIRMSVERSAAARWLVLAGSLPPGAGEDFWARVIAAVRAEHGERAPRIAVDSSGEALAHAARAGADLLKPNAEELLDLARAFGADDEQLDPARLEAEPALAAEIAHEVPGVGALLVTLGAAGALLVGTEETWFGTGPAIAARSTVGAGDSSLAGYLIAETEGAAADACLRQAIAFGRAAASLPGSTLPARDSVDISDVTVSSLGTVAPDPESAPAQAASTTDRKQ